MSFTSQVGNWTDEAVDDVDQLMKSVIFELFTSVILDTPVLEGRLRGNWIISSDNPASGTFDIIDKDGKVTTRKVEDFLTKLSGKKDFSVFLTNNLPYAFRIEFDGYSKKKAPEGMVRKNFIRITNNLKAA